MADGLNGGEKSPLARDPRRSERDRLRDRRALFSPLTNPRSCEGQIWDNLVEKFTDSRYMWILKLAAGSKGMIQ